MKNKLAEDSGSNFDCGVGSKLLNEDCFFLFVQQFNLIVVC